MAAPQPDPRRPLPRIDPARCTGCGWCVAVCPPHVLSLQVVAWRKRSVLEDEAGCTGCSKCEPRCPFGAIRMERPQRPDSGSGSAEGSGSSSSIS